MVFKYFKNILKINKNILKVNKNMRAFKFNKLINILRQFKDPPSN